MIDALKKYLPDIFVCAGLDAEKIEPGNGDMVLEEYLYVETTHELPRYNFEPTLEDDDEEEDMSFQKVCEALKTKLVYVRCINGCKPAGLIKGETYQVLITIPANVGVINYSGREQLVPGYILRNQFPYVWDADRFEGPVDLILESRTVAGLVA
jgi:hypothetical protein